MAEGENKAGGGSGADAGASGKKDAAGKKTKEEVMLFDEIAQNLFVAMSAYGLADLRQLARKGKLEGDEDLQQKLLTLPISRVEAVTLFMDNIEVLKKEMNTDIYMDGLKHAGSAIVALSEEKEKHDEKQSEGTASTTKPRTLEESIKMHRQSVDFEHDQETIEVFDDGIDDSKQESSDEDKKKKKPDQLVYMIEVHRGSQEFKLVFRGSVTAIDWMHDANCMPKYPPNPVYDENNTEATTIPQSKKIGVHDGFYSYLFKKPKHDEQGKNKYDTINEHLERLRQEYPDYSLTVTGHSLGAALATLYTYQAAVDGLFSPVTCMTFATPRVGNDDFVRSFQELEVTGKIRYMRITNNKDVIPQLPDRPFFPVPAVYGHAGLELFLYSGGAHEFQYPFMCKSGGLTRHKFRLAALYFKPPTWIASTLVSPQDKLKFHGCHEYMQRLDKSKNRDLQETTLDKELKKYHEGAK